MLPCVTSLWDDDRQSPQNDLRDRTLMKKENVSSMPRLHDGVEHVKGSDVEKANVQGK